MPKLDKMQPERNTSLPLQGKKSLVQQVQSLLPSQAERGSAGEQPYITLNAVRSTSCSPTAFLSVLYAVAPCSTAVSLPPSNCPTEFYITVTAQVHTWEVNAAQVNGYGLSCTLKEREKKVHLCNLNYWLTMAKVIH